MLPTTEVMARDDVLGWLDPLLLGPEVLRTLDGLIPDLETALRSDPLRTMSWVNIPLQLYGRVPEGIRSSWMFILRRNTNTGTERHPNSHQRMVSYRGHGDFQVHDGRAWVSRALVSDRSEPLERRWISIPANRWHRAVVPAENWVVVSFHSALPEELIEERPVDDRLEEATQAHYWGRR